MGWVSESRCPQEANGSETLHSSKSDFRRSLHPSKQRKSRGLCPIEVAHHHALAWLVGGDSIVEDGE